MSPTGPIHFSFHFRERCEIRPLATATIIIRLLSEPATNLSMGLKEAMEFFQYILDVHIFLELVFFYVLRKKYYFLHVPSAHLNKYLGMFLIMCR